MPSPQLSHSFKPVHQLQLLLKKLKHLTLSPHILLLSRVVHSKASLSMHMQAPATCPAVFPNGIDCDASSAVDSSVNSASVGDSVGSVEDAVLHV